MEHEKLHELKSLIREYSPLLIAVSGGLDSTFLAWIASGECGGAVTAVHLVSEFTIPAESAFIRDFTAEHAIAYRELRVQVMNTPGITDNPPDRCYHCKKAMFTELVQLAKELGSPTVADGTTLDDDHDYRPGYRAIRELGVVSPLKEAGFSRQLIEQTIRDEKLPIPELYSNSCLATRIPYNTTITGKMLDSIRHAEEFLSGKGFGRVRVRHHQQVARLELPVDDALQLLSNDTLREEIVTELKKSGFSYITIDAEGFNSGSMNRTITGEDENE